MTRLILSLVCALFALPLVAQNFEILSANYGAGRNRIDVTERVRALIRGNGVEFTVDGESLGDPMPGVEKTLTIRYSMRNRVRTSSFKDHDVVRIGNPSSAATAADVTTANSGNLTIHSARYGEGRRWMDVTEVLRNNLRNNTVRLAITNQVMGGDPAPATAKYLEVDYESGGQRRTERFPENETLQLVSGYFSGTGSTSGGPTAGSIFGSSNLEVISARYGTLGTNVDVADQVRRNIQRGRLNMNVDSSTLGSDPSGRRINELVVEFMSNGQRQTRIFRDGDTVSLH